MIPSGRVLSYGDIAELLGSGGARQVGKAMAQPGVERPWWRVIRSDGTITEALSEQAAQRWVEEQTPRRGDRVDMSRARWQPSHEQWHDIERLAASLGTAKLSVENDEMGS